MANFDDGATRNRKSEERKALYFNLMDILEECRMSKTTQIGPRGGVSRAWLAEQLGCDASTLSNSPKLSGYIRRWEAWNLAKLENTVRRGVGRSSISASEEGPESNVVSFRKQTDDGRIVLAPYGKTRRTIIPVPTLIWRDGIDVEVSDYARHLILRAHLAASSVEEFLKVLRIFTRYRRNLGLAWHRVDDDVLLGWQAQMLGSDIPVPRRNYCLSIVHGFYRWAEETGRLKYHVRIGRRTEYPKDMYSYQFPISSVEIRSASGRLTSSRWQTPLTEKIGHGGYGFRNTPNTEQILKLFGLVAQDGEHGVRNHLMMSWALECGARLHELLQPTLDDIPTPDQIAKVIANDFWVIKVKRKGQKGKAGKLVVSSDLILRTFDYIHHERKATAEKCRAAGREPSNFVFISAKTGDALHNDSVTRICGKIFKEAKVEKANIHRLRAAYITREVERCLIAVESQGNSLDSTSTWHETVLTMAAQMMGHTSILSLRPYLNHLLTRRLQTMESRKAASGTDELSEQRGAHEYAAENAELIRAMSLRQQGRYREASEILIAQGVESKRLGENRVPLAA